MLASALLFVTVIGTQGQGGNVPSQDFLAWRGWTYLGGAPNAGAALYPLSFPYDQVPAASESTPWRAKVFILRSIERVGRDADGILRTDRETLEDPQIASLKVAMGRVAQRVGLATQGQVSLQVDYEEEAENLRGKLDGDAYGEADLRAYLANRLNGGGYEAEDKVYRGPYPSVFVVIPGAVVPKQRDFEVHGMPVTVLSYESLSGGNARPELESAFVDAWRSQVARRATARGWGALSTTDGEPIKWSDLADVSEPSGKLQAQRVARTKLRVADAFGAPVLAPRSWVAPYSGATVVTDADKGSVIQLSLEGRTRGGGVALPVRADGEPFARLSQTPTLSLNLKLTSTEPLAMRLEGRNGKRLWVSFGREIRLTNEPQWPIRSAPVKSDGSWQHVAVNLADVAKAAGVDEVVALAVEFSPRSRQFARDQITPAQVVLDDVRFGTESEAGIVADADPEAQRAKVAAAATASSPELIAMLSDASPLVRLNAADAFTRIKDPSAEAALAAATNDLNQVTAERAVDALANLGTDTSRDILRRTMRNSLGEFTRAEAARRMGETKDPKLGGDISILLASRNWLTRLAAVEALTALPGREAAILRLAFLAQDSPEIKQAVIRGVDASDEGIARRLLWPMVNEPLDAIRAACALKLMESSVPDLRKEAFAALKDDSRTVRRLVLEGMVAKPNEAFREAFQIAVTDSTPSVRAAALRGFGTLKDGASADEIGPAMDDTSEDVSLALVGLAKVKKVTLPEATLARLKASPFASVKQATGELAP